MIRIVGDINFADGFFDIGLGIGSSIKKGHDPFKHIYRERSDVWIGNFECVASAATNKRDIYRKQFLVDPGDLKHITHLSIYSAANNHVMQHGEAAYFNMLTYIESTGSSIVGSIAKRSVVVEHQKKKVGVVAFSQKQEKYSPSALYWSNPECSEIQRELEKLSRVDYKIAYVHWGDEFIDRPCVDQKRFAHWLADIGFDLIIGTHPHVLQGYEIYKKKHIFYSLGNFVFNMPLESTRYSCILGISLLSDRLDVSYEYAFIGNDNFPKVVSKNDVPLEYRFEYLNEQLANEEESESYYASVSKFLRTYRVSNYQWILRNLFRYRGVDICALLADFIKRRLIHR